MAENKFLDDIAKFSNSTLSAMGSMQKQVRKWVSEQTEVLVKNMDLVTKSEFEALQARFDALEKKLEKSKTAAPKAKAKTTAK